MPAFDFVLKPLRSLLAPRGSSAPSGRAAPGTFNGVAGAPPMQARPAGSPAATVSDLVTLNHVWSEQPNALKLQSSRLLLPIGERRDYDDREQAKDSPLARLLFDVTGVTRVELNGSYVTVLMAEDADWDAILEEVQRTVSKFLNAGGLAIEGNGQPAAGKKRFAFGFRQVSSRPPEEQKRLVQALLDEEVNPAVAAHGGLFSLIDVKDDTVYVQLGGGCQGCGMVDVTLRQGVEQRMREVLPEMVALVDVTDHASGTDPYYQAGKK